jgi:NAD-dependent deacetylase
MAKKKFVVLTGAGISAESGIATFRDAGGLWEGHDVMQVASPQGWKNDKALVLDFYNNRRRQLQEVQPNAAHYAIAQLQKHFDVYIITQNVDDLHERAGSKQVLHLHGELLKVRSTLNPKDVMPWKTDLNIGDKCQKGAQLRPDIVWFGEDVPLISDAIDICQEADIFAIVGTSMQVYPAAGLVDYIRDDVQKYYIDPNPQTIDVAQLIVIPEIASIGVGRMCADYLKLV